VETNPAKGLDFWHFVFTNYEGLARILQYQTKNCLRQQNDEAYARKNSKSLLRLDAKVGYSRNAHWPRRLRLKLAIFGPTSRQKFQQYMKGLQIQQHNSASAKRMS
jgi:hypothetical protein